MVKNDVEYIIYCRKSTDEKSGMQTQSIPDQIQKCVEYAEKNGLTIKAKPKDFMFESLLEVERENNDNDPMNRKIFRETRWLYIIKEQETAKVPYKRKKWRRLIKIIEDGKIDGIISYSPDRQARNVLEWWELINLVDNDQVDLKYTNFHFEPNASGKMMLGIWFVLSKQYSDKLSEDIWRGNRSAFLRGKAIWKKKYGYTINEDWYHEPDPKNFKLMRKAFELKIYDNKSDDYIASFLNKHWYEKSDWLEINPKRLWVIWRDPFYYWVAIREKAWLTVNLLETNSHYEQIITEDEYFTLQDRFLKRTPHTLGKAQKDEYDGIRLAPENLLKNEEGYWLAFYITPKKRFQAKLDKLRITKPQADWKDVVAIHQTRYRLVNKKSKEDGLEITWEFIEKAVSTYLKTIKISDKAYKAFIDYARDIMEQNNTKNNQEASRIMLLLNRKKSEKTAFIQKCLGEKFTSDQQKAYEDTLKKFEAEIEYYHKEIENISSTERSEIMEQVALVDLMKNMSSRFEKGTIVQKRKIIGLLFSNITVSNKKKLTLAVKPWLEALFAWELEIIGKISNISPEGLPTLLKGTSHSHIHAITRFGIQSSPSVIWLSKLLSPVQMRYYSTSFMV